MYWRDDESAPNTRDSTRRAAQLAVEDTSAAGLGLTYGNQDELPVRRVPPAWGAAGVRTLRWARALATIVGGTLRDVDIVVHGDLLLSHERDDGTQLIADRSPGQLSCLLA